MSDALREQARSVPTGREVRLVLAARAVAFGDHSSPPAIKELDAASEAYAADVPWENEPASGEAEADARAGLISRQVVLSFLRRRAEEHANLVLTAPGNSRHREGMEAAFTEAANFVSRLPTTPAPSDRQKGEG